MTRQLGLFTQASGPAVEARTFHRRPDIDRSGMGAYLHLIRAPDDPERTEARGRANRDVSPHLTIKRTSTVEQWRARYLACLADGVPRTFQRIAVEVSGYDANVLFEGPADDALWELVDAGEVELTLEVPILFRKAV